MNLRLVIALLLLALARPALALPSDNDPLPVDPGVRIGRLENGLTYYIRENHKPEHRADLRVVINAGSILEREDQRGYAHFIEHMAFNGTEHFEANELVTFLESIGARFGADLNAYTSFDETVYMLEIPTDRDGLLDQGMLVLSDWAHAVTFDPEEVIKERGVILEEWRQGRGAQERIRRVQWPVLLAGSLYPERLPIGVPETIETATAEGLRAFYQRWYRPNLMAVIAVGDFAPDSLEALVRAHFADIPRPATPAERPVLHVESPPGLRATPASDRELMFTQVSLAHGYPAPPQGTVGDYRRALVDGLFAGMLNNRLAEICLKPNSPFTLSMGAAGSVVRTYATFRVMAIVPEGRAERGLRAIGTEEARIRAHGFTAGELDRAKLDVLAGLEKAYNERDKTENGAYVREYTANFLDGEPIPGIAVEYPLVRELMAGITLDEVNAATQRLLDGENAVILASGPERTAASLPDSAALVAIAAEAMRSTPAAYEDSVAATALMTTLPEPGSVAARRAIPELGLDILTLSNGIEVWLKPTPFKNDEIIFAGWAMGGTSLADTATYRSADFAVSYVQEAGFGGFTPTDLEKIMAGRIASATPVIDGFQQGVHGRATPKDLETALQLVHLIFTAPNDRPEAFEVVKERLRTFLENRAASPEVLFADSMMVVNHGGHTMYRPWSAESLAALDRATAYDFYRRLFANAADFRFCFVGAFSPEEIEPLLARYLGSLPGRPGTRSTFRDPGLRFPSGVIERTVVAGTEPKSRTAITWPALTGLDEMEMFHLRAAGDILEIRLRERLREALSGTYSVTAAFTTLMPYPGYATTAIGFGSSPESAADLTREVLAEVARFKADGPTEEEAATIREILLRELETSLEQNGYWLSSLTTVDMLGWDPRRILARRERIESITPAKLRETFSRYYPDTNYTVIRLVPETAGGSAPR